MSSGIKNKLKLSTFWRFLKKFKKDSKNGQKGEGGIFG